MIIILFKRPYREHKISNKERKREKKMEKILKENQPWIDSVWGKIEKKLFVTAELSKNKIPYTTKAGVHDDKSNALSSWTNGFWSGLMWLMYKKTGNQRYKLAAENVEKKLDKVLFSYEELYHDVGFMWHLSAGANYKITGNLESKNRNLIAAAALASRFNVDGGFIRAWNDENATGWSIIDCMMNLPLLYWASEEIGDPRFRQIAMHQADKTMEHHIRADGSVYHVVEYDINTGEFLGTPHTQGYNAACSTWSRGQAWAVYGFVLSYIHTGKQEYLDTAKKTAHYFISAVCTEGYIPKCDFRSPESPDYLDTSAGVIAACGLIEIAKAVSEYEKKLYIKAAINILKAIEAEHCDWSDKEQSIVQNGMEFYKKGEHISMIYSDYYFVEAIYKLTGGDLLFW